MMATVATMSCAGITNRIRLQGSTACLTPNTDILGSDYDDLAAAKQYSRRLAMMMMKNTDNVNHDTHNYWHHYAEFNWDEPNRWWAQIAGDCDLERYGRPQRY